MLSHLFQDWLKSFLCVGKLHFLMIENWNSMCSFFQSILWIDKTVHYEWLNLYFFSNIIDILINNNFNFWFRTFSWLSGTWSFFSHISWKIFCDTSSKIKFSGKLWLKNDTYKWSTEEYYTSDCQNLKKRVVKTS